MSINLVNPTIPEYSDDFHYNIPRRVPKDITEYWTDETLRDRIAGTNGFIVYEGIHVGDYINMGRPVTCPNIEGDALGVVGSQYVTVASCGGLQGNGYGNGFLKNHLVMVPGKGYEGKCHFGMHRMNQTDTTEDGYAGSEMNTVVIGPVATEGSIAEGATINQQLKYIFGDMLQTTKELLTNEINPTLYNKYGTPTGASSRWGWYDCQAILMSEVELYGATIWGSSGYDIGNACYQFDFFRYNKFAINNHTTFYWLKDVVDKKRYANVGINGDSLCDNASGIGIGIRPRFVLA